MAFGSQRFYNSPGKQVRNFLCYSYIMRARVLRGVVFLAGLTLIVYGALYLGQLARDNVFIQEAVRRFGYLGIFTVSLVSGFNLVVPVPAISFLPLFLESGLSAILTVLIIIIGMTVADLIAYYLGRAGRHLVIPKQPLVLNLEKLKERYYWTPVIILVFYAAFVPLPNEVLVIPLGFLGYQLKHLLLPLLAGNAVFNVLSAVGVVGLFSLL